jgi:hypothetical protein
MHAWILHLKRERVGHGTKGGAGGHFQLGVVVVRRGQNKIGRFYEP